MVPLSDRLLELILETGHRRVAAPEPGAQHLRLDRTAAEDLASAISHVEPNRRDGSSNYVRLNRHRQKGLIENFIEAWTQEPLMKAPRPLVHPDERLEATNPQLRDAEVDLPLEVSTELDSHEHSDQEPRAEGREARKAKT